VAGQVALGVAVRYALDLGLDAIRERVTALAETLRTALAAVDGVTVADTGRVRSGITTFYAEQMDAAEIQAALRERDINTSVSTPNSTRLDADARNLPDLVRASVHYYNTETEVERFVEALDDILAGQPAS
jgi:selenocysteine lyase/cysteine desulfurase